MSRKYWSYSGFGKPELLGTDKEMLEDLTVTSNYLGDVSEDVKEVLRELIDNNAPDEDFNSELYEYGIFCNPTLADFQEFNKSKCLGETTYLEDWL